MVGKSLDRRILPSTLRNLPADLTWTVTLLAVSTLVILLPGLRSTPIRIVLGFILLSAPGYVTIAYLFPERALNPAEIPSSSGRPEDNQGPMSMFADGAGITWGERTALSVVTSLILVALFGMGHNILPWGANLPAVLISIDLYTFAVTILAYQRRAALPESRRLTIPSPEQIGMSLKRLAAPDSRSEAALNFLVVSSVLLAAISVSFAVFHSPETPHSELYLLTENDDGELVADNYPRNATVGNQIPLIVGVSNHENEQMTYTVIVELQRVDIHNETIRTRETQELDSSTVTLEDGENMTLRPAITPRMTGERLRLSIQLYRKKSVSNPSVDNAYREVHLWLNVSEPIDG